jgi:hypothetical protein
VLEGWRESKRKYESIVEGEGVWCPIAHGGKLKNEQDY